jgi:hypothetical protein
MFTAAIKAKIEAVAGSRVVAWRRVTQAGYTPAGRWIVRLANGSSGFAKVGLNRETASWLRSEHNIYRQLRAGFMPELLGWEDDGEIPILLLEDLSSAEWPPPWSSDKVDRVLAVLHELRTTTVPDHLPALESARSMLSGWSRVADEPNSFLTLRLCSPAWLEAALPSLLRAEAEAPLAGSELLHLDVRSDNICFAGERTLLIDWNWASVGNSALDLVAWLPSLRDEGGPSPETLISGQAGLVALIAGYFADHARQPPIQDAPRVRPAQRRMLAVALPWVAQVLDLLPPDGILDDPPPGSAPGDSTNRVH